MSKYKGKKSAPLDGSRTDFSGLKIHVSTHATCNSYSGRDSRCYRHDELKYQLPSIFCIRCTHNRKFFKVNNFWRVEGRERLKRSEERGVRREKCLEGGGKREEGRDMNRAG